MLTDSLQNKIWFSDEPNVGALILARFDPERGVIEAYRLLATVRNRAFSRWEWDPDVGIHSFDPIVKLFLDQPIVALSGEARKGSFRNDLRMDLGTDRMGIFSELVLARAVEPEKSNPRMELWPPRKFPAKHRVRSTSHDAFSGKFHRPQRFDEICDGAFRIKKWHEFRPNMGVPFGIRMGEAISTYSTLPEDAYTPTRQKPWNGIWVGDYSGHGCEFLLILHIDFTEASPSQSSSSNVGPESVEATEIGDATWRGEDGPGNLDAAADTLKTLDEGLENKSEYVPKGGLVAIKLTGDPNVPRGEISFMVKDIGEDGLIRVAEEEIFRGARIVRSRGHIAGHNFRNGKYAMMFFS